MTLSLDKPSTVVIQPGTFVRPSGAQLRSVPDETSLLEVWWEVGPCLAYPKPDGWRLQVHKAGEVIRLFSRSGKDWAEVFPSVAQVICAQLADDRAILDTELVGFDINGAHTEPARLRRAAQYRCYVLDALYLDRMDLTPLPAQERVLYLQNHLHDALRGMVVLAEYTYISSQEEWLAFYQSCWARRREGFDGAIIKRLDAPYFADVLKVKPEDTIDAVVVGAYYDRRGAIRSLLLAMPDHQRRRWVPITKVARKNTDWDAVWTACQPHILDHCPLDMDKPPDLPDIWIAPEVVVTVPIQSRSLSSVDLQLVGVCTLREDKGPEDATPFEQILEVAGVTRKPLQLSLFEVMNADTADRWES